MAVMVPPVTVKTMTVSGRPAPGDQDAGGTVDDHRMHERAGARGSAGLSRDLPGAADDHGPGGAGGPELDVRGKDGQQPGEVAPASRGEERVDDLPGR